MAARGLTYYGSTNCPDLVAEHPCSKTRLCILKRHRSTLDHPRLWTDDTGELVFTAEPYEISGSAIAALVAELTELGLEADITGDSPWLPGSTLLITIRKDNQ